MEAASPFSAMTHEEREALLWRAAEICPYSTYVRTHIADFLSKDVARAEEALAQYAIAVKLNEDDDEARLGLAMHLATLERYLDALPHFAILAERGPPSAVVLHLRGTCLWELGLLDEAEASFQRAIDLQPRRAGTLRCLAPCRRARGDEAGAKKLEREAEFHQSGRLPAGR